MFFVGDRSPLLEDLAIGSGTSYSSKSVVKFFFTHDTSTIFFSNLLRSILFQLFQNCTVSLGPYKFLPTSNLVKDLESTGVLGSGGKIENHFVKLPDYEISCVWILLCRGVRPYPSDPGHK